MSSIYFRILFVILALNSGFGQKVNPNYDAELAQKLGADDYGMRSYVLVILKTGTNNSSDASTRAKAFEGHMKNMSTMVEKDQLVVAGPLETNENNYRGIFILKAKTLEEARDILKTDPAIDQKYLEPELYMWYGSAALPEYLPVSDKIWKIGF
jgi:uncharacterized protein YciI